MRAHEPVLCHSSYPMGMFNITMAMVVSNKERLRRLNAPGAPDIIGSTKVRDAPREQPMLVLSDEEWPDDVVPAPAAAAAAAPAAQGSVAVGEVEPAVAAAGDHGTSATGQAAAEFDKEEEKGEEEEEGEEDEDGEEGQTQDEAVSVYWEGSEGEEGGKDETASEGEEDEGEGSTGEEEAGGEVEGDEDMDEEDEDSDSSCLDGR